MITLETKDFIVTYPDDQETKDKVFKALIDWYVKYESFHGGLIMQSDDPQIYAPILLSEIADDIIKFKTEYKEG